MNHHFRLHVNYVASMSFSLCVFCRKVCVVIQSHKYFWCCETMYHYNNIYIVVSLLFTKCRQWIVHTRRFRQHHSFRFLHCITWHGTMITEEHVYSFSEFLLLSKHRSFYIFIYLKISTQLWLISTCYHETSHLMPSMPERSLKTR